jgi:hypothetical protein
LPTKNEKESSSFLKKRTKKLCTLAAAFPERLGPECKSFLLLFFKKEVLPYRCNIVTADNPGAP